MFWSEIGGRAQIERSSMDGSERKVVISHGLSWPVSVTVDILTDKLYWTDEKLKCIGSATLDGENMRVMKYFMYTLVSFCLETMKNSDALTNYNDKLKCSKFKRIDGSEPQL